MEKKGREEKKEFHSPFFIIFPFQPCSTAGKREEGREKKKENSFYPASQLPLDVPERGGKGKKKKRKKKKSAPPIPSCPAHAVDVVTIVTSQDKEGGKKGRKKKKREKGA